MQKRVKDCHFHVKSPAQILQYQKRAQKFISVPCDTTKVLDKSRSVKPANTVSCHVKFKGFVRKISSGHIIWSGCLNKRKFVSSMRGIWIGLKKRWLSAFQRSWINVAYFEMGLIIGNYFFSFKASKSYPF